MNFMKKLETKEVTPLIAPVPDQHFEFNVLPYWRVVKTMRLTFTKPTIDITWLHPELCRVSAFLPREYCWYYASWWNAACTVCVWQPKTSRTAACSREGESTWQGYSGTSKLKSPVVLKLSSSLPKVLLALSLFDAKKRINSEHNELVLLGRWNDKTIS